MSISESNHATLDEDNFDESYESFVERTVREDGPISFRQLKQELENEKRYDSFTDPEEVDLRDSEALREAFHGLREKNRQGVLDDEIAASYCAGQLYLRVMDDFESIGYSLDSELYESE